jgi:hypothetical protein
MPERHQITVLDRHQFEFEMVNGDFLLYPNGHGDPIVLTTTLDIETGEQVWHSMEPIPFLPEIGLAIENYLM